ncbi:flippase-like domain-containing protein [Myxococcus llanfairpwllgwyngyllgogerychwyrndrobwllllantysiliogogogochensis]|uniref:Flippase-like domain-containing protein n=2 Tax=Myxococcus llanfairpwllgwyngyllgogerychwyrndrobwllllantysiliogogogochensis TaxID=2590453 RepID=A0A540WMS8_9BACT|nr:flippase-like domain-containing protein [Myxococcus llanfairpwllgwyngyllgogerychwyrndrobwllllantysiliogogogochensis]
MTRRESPLLEREGGRMHDGHAVSGGGPPSASAEGSSRHHSVWGWLPGVVLLGAFIAFVVLRFGEERQFAQMLKRARPEWLLAGAVLQVFSYLTMAGCWLVTLSTAGVKAPWMRTAGLALMKLSFDQLVPTAGIGGSVVVMKGLRKEGAPPRVATAALLVDMVSFYAAHAVAVVISILIIWFRAQLHAAILGLATAFAALACAVPFGILWLTRHGGWQPPRWARRIPGLSGLLESISQVPPELVRDKWLLVRASALQFATFVLDALTLSCMFFAVGHPVDFPDVFAAFMLATLVMTLSIIPGGVGTFEATAVGTLSSLGVPVEVGLTAVMLLRGFTLWLPLPLGVVLLRRMLGVRLRDAMSSPGSESSASPVVSSEQRTA